MTNRSPAILPEPSMDWV